MASPRLFAACALSLVWAGCLDAALAPAQNAGGELPPGGDEELLSTCEAPAKILDGKAFTSCAPDAACLPVALVVQAAPDFVDRLAVCEGDAESRCVPNSFFEFGAAFTAASCSSMRGAEGRCISMAIPEVDELSGLLPQDACAATERCVPCFDPTGRDLGVCNLGCDTGAKSPAVQFPTCGEGAGVCIAAADIPDDAEGSLQELECEEDVELCIPNEILDPASIEACSGEIGFGVGPYVGVYLNTEVLDIDNSNFFDENPNNNDFSCVPCFNPSEDNRPPTGVTGCDRHYPNGEPPLN